MKFIKRLLTFIIILVVIICIAGAVLLNMTPNQLGFGDKVLYDDITLDGIGLGDTKLYKIASSIQGILNPNESKIVDNEVNSEVEEAKVTEAFAEGNLAKTEDGSYDYLDLIDNQVLYDEEYLLSYSDTTLAFIFDSMVSQAEDGADANFQFLADMEASVSEISITKENDAYKLRVILGLSTESIKTEIEDNLGAAKSFIKIGERIYIACYLNITADTLGKIQTTGINVLVNDSDNDVSNAIFDALVSSLGEFASSDDPKAEINENVGNAFSTIVGNLGLVGTATVDDNKVVTAKTLGPEGITEHTISVITIKE